MALTRHHPGGPDRTYLSITLPGSEKNGVYSHDEVDGHPTRREYVDTVIKAKDDDDTVLEIRFKYLLDSANSQTRNNFNDYDTLSNRKHGFVKVEYDITKHTNIVINIPETATLVPGWYPLVHYNSTLQQYVSPDYTIANLSGVNVPSTPQYFSTALTIDLDRFTSRRRIIYLKNYGKIIGMGGQPFKRVLPVAGRFIQMSFGGASINYVYNHFNNDRRWYDSNGSLNSVGYNPSGGGRRMDQNVDGQHNALEDTHENRRHATYNIAGTPVYCHDWDGNNPAFYQVQLPENPMDAIRIINIRGQTGVFIYNESTGRILPGGGAGGGGPAFDINMNSVPRRIFYITNHGAYYQRDQYIGGGNYANLYSNSVAIDGYIPSHGGTRVSSNNQPVGQGHPFNYTTTGPIVYPFIGGGRGGRGAGWHYMMREIDPSTGERLDGSGNWGHLGYFQDGAGQRYDDSVNNVTNRFRYGTTTVQNYIGTWLSTHLYDGSLLYRSQGGSMGYHDFEYNFQAYHGQAYINHGSYYILGGAFCMFADGTANHNTTTGIRLGMWGAQDITIQRTLGGHPLKWTVNQVNPGVNYMGYYIQNTIHHVSTGIHGAENANMIPDQRGVQGDFPGAVGYTTSNKGLPNCVNGEEPVPFNSNTAESDYRYFYYRNMGGHGGGFGENGKDARTFPYGYDPEKGYDKYVCPLFEFHNDSDWSLYGAQNVTIPAWMELQPGTGGIGGKAITLKNYTLDPSLNLSTMTSEDVRNPESYIASTNVGNELQKNVRLYLNDGEMPSNYEVGEDFTT